MLHVTEQVEPPDRSADATGIRRGVDGDKWEWGKSMTISLLALIAVFAVSAHAQTSTEAPKARPDRRLRIIERPRPVYNADAGCVVGTVILRVTFLSSGEIGSIAVVKGLPKGLTEDSIDAAQRIMFEPMIKDGEPKTVTKQIEYLFRIQ